MHQSHAQSALMVICTFSACGTIPLTKVSMFEALGSFKVAIIDPIIGSIIFTIKLFLEPIFD